MSLRFRLAALAVLSVATALVVALLPSAAPADSGGIDNAYGTNGSALVPTPTGTSTFNDSIRLADGSIVAVGATGVAGSRNVIVAKFTPAGPLDASFGTGGVVTYNVPGGTEDRALGVSERPGGFIVTGTSDTADGVYFGAQAFVSKLSSAGVLVPSWGTAGTALPSTANFTRISDAVELPSGNVIAVGVNYDAFQPVDAELTSAGAVNAGSTIIPSGLDNPGSYAPTNPATPSQNFSTNLIDLGSGSYVFGYAGTYTAGDSETKLVTFGNNTAGNAVSTSVTGDLAVSHLTRIGARTVLVGGVQPGGAGLMRGALWGFTTAGAVDASFGSSGQMLLPTANEAWAATGLATTTAGTHYVVGSLGANRVRTVRLTSGFALDTTFGDTDTGIADRTYGAAPTRANNVQVDAQDRPVLVGSEATQAATFRLERFNYASTSLGEVTYSPSFVQRLSTVTWSYSVSNTGPDRSGAVAIDIDIPASVEGKTYTPSTGSVAPVADGSGGVWTVPQLAAGASATLKLSGRPNDVGNLTTTATLLSQASQRVGAAPVAKSATVRVFGAATPRDDVIVGTPQDDTIDSLAGNDYVYGRGSDDNLFGNEGNDSLYGETGDDTVDGGNGDDRVFGNEGTDRVIGGSGNDALDGGPGNDKLFGGAGNDLLKGASGNDRLEGGPGNDKLLGGVGNDYLIAQYGTDLLIAGPGADRLDGSQAGDVLYAGTGNDHVNGKTGADKIYGEEGSDWLRGQEGADWIWGGSGNDLLNGGAGKDHLNAGSGLDVIRADDGKGGDVIDCGSGWDLVYANVGDKVAKNCEFVKYDVFADTAK